MRRDIDARKDEIIELLQNGTPQAYVARLLGCKITTLTTRLKKWGASHLKNQNRKGRPHPEGRVPVVEYLKNNPKVAKVNHPALSEHPNHELYKRYFPNGAGSIFTFDIKGGTEEAQTFIDHLKIFSLLANVADVKSLVIHPASTTHSQLSADELEDQGIHQSTIRLSIGTEHIDDIIDDLEQAFQAI